MGQVDLSFGAYLLGVSLNTYFYGIVTFQYISYHVTKFNDPWYIRALVFSLLSLDTAESVGIVYMAWIYNSQLYSDPMALPNPTKLFAWTNISFSITALLVQTFLSYRIYRLKGSMIGVSITCFLAIVSFILGVVIAVSVTRLRSLAEAVTLGSITIVWLCLEIIVDWINAGALTIILLRSRTGLHRSNRIINRLIRASLQTGLFATTFTTVSLILFLKYPNTQLFSILGLPLGRLYSATIMDTLLVRRRLRQIVRGRRTATSSIWMLESEPRKPRTDSFPRSIRNTFRSDQSANGVDLSVPSSECSDLYLENKNSVVTAVESG